MNSTSIVSPLILLLASTAHTQDLAPYAGQQDRGIKALSEAEIESYLSGEGMGLAKAAELNGHPGPRHVLELADNLDLTLEQRRDSQKIFDEMHAEALRLGKQIVERERDLDRALAAEGVDREMLRAALEELGRLQARLRYTHLAAHIAQREVLNEEQISAYRALRGYGSGADGPAHGDDHH